MEEYEDMRMRSFIRNFGAKIFGNVVQSKRSGRKDRKIKMYIKSIVLDGFKSYAQRTEVSGFDFNFNAITGLNGSGKSNILDSICFLLGISNLHQVKWA